MLYILVNKNNSNMNRLPVDMNRHKNGVEAYCFSPITGSWHWPLTWDQTIDTTPEDNIKSLHPIRALVIVLSTRCDAIANQPSRHLESARIRNQKSDFNNIFSVINKIKMRSSIR